MDTSGHLVDTLDISVDQLFDNTPSHQASQNLVKA